MADSVNHFAVQMSDREFRTISKYIEETVGIQMPDSKRIMMQSRLSRRIRTLGLATYKAYIEYAFSNDEELVLMIDALTTNKTEFFREADHFAFLRDKALPEFAQNGLRKINVWSAGCSSGEEPYTLAIVLKEFIRNNTTPISHFSVTGTDISTKVLDKAYNAVYDLESVLPLSDHIKKTYFLKSTVQKKGVARVKPDLRSYVTFRRLNFMDNDFCMPDMYEVIFCRNVLIYFDKPTQEKVIRKFMKYLVPNGYLFLGHSETIFSMDLPLRTCAPTVYKKVL